MEVRREVEGVDDAETSSGCVYVIHASMIDPFVSKLLLPSLFASNVILVPEAKSQPYLRALGSCSMTLWPAISPRMRYRVSRVFGKYARTLRVSILTFLHGKSGPHCIVSRTRGRALSVRL